MTTKKRRSATTMRRESSSSPSSESFDRGRQIARTLDVLQWLAKEPMTSEQIAGACDISVRTTLRFMKSLSDRAPVYQRRTPGGEMNWALDVEKFVARFKPS